jgi:hypothetical protein
MQKTSRTPPVISPEEVETNVVRLQRRSAAIRDDDTSRPEEVEELAALMERASNAARQMKYFGLAMKRFSWEELVSSARRAGFAQIDTNLQSKEASFQWASRPADLIFSVSFRDRSKISTIAESQADISGLVLTAYSHVDSVSVEINPTVVDSDLGRNALLFRDMLLAFPGFDDMPAWAKYPEGRIPEAGGLVEMWRDGESVASVFGRTWDSISPRVVAIWERLRRRWNSLQ